MTIDAVSGHSHIRLVTVGGNAAIVRIIPPRIVVCPAIIINLVVRDPDIHIERTGFATVPRFRMIELDTEEFIVIDLVVVDLNGVAVRQSRSADSQAVISHVLACINLDPLAGPSSGRIAVVGVRVNHIIRNACVLRVEQEDTITVVRDDVVPNRRVRNTHAPPAIECEVCSACGLRSQYVVVTTHGETRICASLHLLVVILGALDREAFHCNVVGNDLDDILVSAGCRGVEYHAARIGGVARQRQHLVYQDRSIMVIRPGGHINRITRICGVDSVLN